MTQVLVMSDPHCGHRAGLTPPAYWWVEDPEDDARYKWALMMRETWTDFLSMIEPYRGCDVLIINGDAVDGKGEKSGGTELITSDPDEQAIMAARCVKEINPKVVLMTYGTPYHTGMIMDYEKIVAREVGAAKIESEAKYRIEGKLLNVKHFISSSVIPHGRFTALERDKLWAAIWAEMYGNEKPDITIRSHVHYYAQNDSTPFGLGIITPALEGPGTKHGGRRCMGWVDFGIVGLELEYGEKIKWQVDRRRLSSISQEPLDVMALLNETNSPQEDHLALSAEVPIS